MRKALTIPLILMFTLPGCGLTVGGPPVLSTQSAGCSSLTPRSWHDGIPAPPYPDPIVGALISAYNVLEGLLESANDRQKATMDIQERCEARDAAAVHRATRRRFLGL